MNREITELAKILALKVRRDILTGTGGTILTRKHGAGLEFNELREYWPSDDARHIHWPSVMNGGQPRLKLYREEQEITDCIALDVSQSMTCNPRKWNLATETATLLTAVAALCGNGGTWMAFAGQVVARESFGTGTRELQKITTTTLQQKQCNRQTTDLDRALNDIANALQKPHRIFIISDFIGQDCLKPLTRLTHRHDATLCHVMPENLEEITPHEQMEIMDAETGERKTVTTPEHENLPAEMVAQLQKTAAQAQANYIHLNLNQSPAQTILKYGYKNNLAKL